MERLLKDVGPWHIPVFLLALTGSLPYGLFVISLSFMAPKMNYWCKPPAGVNHSQWLEMNDGVYPRCEVRSLVTRSSGDNMSTLATEKCLEWEYDHTFHTRTLIEEWNAVCDRHWMLATAQSCLMFGVLVGCFVFSHISDWYGRKRCYVLSLALIIMTGFAISFTHDYWAFCALRFLMAVGHGGKRVANAITAECVGANHRAIVTVGQDIGWCLGLILTPLITYYIRDWVWIQRTIMLPEFAFIVLAYYLDESPKWLLSAGREEEARQVLTRIIQKNGLSLRKDLDVDVIIRETTEALQKEKRTQRGTLLDLLRGWKVFKLSVSCWGQYGVIILLYYHMMYFIVDIGSNPYMGVLYMALLEVPITAAAWWVVNNFRRRPVYIWSYLLSIFSVVALLLPSEDAVGIRMVLANLGKMASMFQYNCLLVHISEVFPTKVRSVALGTSAMSSRIGAMAAPFLKEVGLATAVWVPICVTLGMCTIAMLLSFLLPETFGQKLPDTFHETKQMLRKSPSTTEKPAVTLIP